MTSAGSLALFGLGACASAPPAPEPAAPPPAAIPRFVAPYSYEWFVRAELFEARGQHAAAAEAYRMALAGSDDDPYLYARLAEALDRAGDADEAQQALRDGLALDPESEAVWLARAHIAERHGALAQAYEAYERAEVAAPDAPDAPLALAELLRAQGHPERAIAVLQRYAAHSAAGSVAALRARISLARVRGDGEGLAAAAREYLEGGARDPRLLRRTAAELLAAGRPALASRLLSVLPSGERDARLRLAVALALEQRAQVELLLTATPPEDLGGPLEMADAYLQIGEPARALELLGERDAAVDGDANRRALLRGEALLALGRPGEAAAELMRVPEGSAHRARAVQDIAQALQAAGMADLASEVAAAARGSQ